MNRIEICNYLCQLSIPVLSIIFALQNHLRENIGNRGSIQKIQGYDCAGHW